MRIIRNHGGAATSLTQGVIVPFPPGGSVDVLARSLAVRLAKRLGQSVTVENISGGATIPAVQSLLRSDADGHAMLITSDVTLRQR